MSLAQPLVEAQIPFKIHIVKDHDMKERLCLEVERLGLSAVIMGSRGFGAIKRGNNGRLGSVSNYCVRHCVCPVVVVRYPDEKDGGNAPQVSVAFAAEDEDDTEFHDASDDRKGHYVPQLAEQILHNNKNAPKDDYINLKGFIRRAFFGMGNSSLSEVDAV
ncbi:unnamed protein product [Camellia sinensis]